MKKYIIITYDVCNMGGGQLYVLRRAKYLENLGYKIYIIVTYDNGIFPLKEAFGTTPIILIPEFGFESIKQNRSRKKEILDDVLGRIGEAEDFFVESHTLPTIEWGELLASRLRARHIAYPLAEPSFGQVKYLLGRNIIRKKLHSDEFFGCSSTSLRIIFGKQPEHNNYINIGFNESELVDCSEPSLTFTNPSGSFIVSTVSRLDKTYIEPLIEDSLLLAQNHTDKNFILLIAGGSNTGNRQEYLINKYSGHYKNTPNLNIKFLGYISKLGKDLFEYSDVFVGMGTASINAISQRCITINIDPSRDNLSSGLFSVDTVNFAYSESGKVYSIYEKLEQVFNMSIENREDVKAKGRILFEAQFEAKACFQKIDHELCALKPVDVGSYLKVPLIYYFAARTFIFLRKIYKNIF